MTRENDEGVYIDSVDSPQILKISEPIGLKLCALAHPIMLFWPVLGAPIFSYERNYFGSTRKSLSGGAVPVVEGRKSICKYGTAGRKTYIRDLLWCTDVSGDAWQPYISE